MNSRLSIDNFIVEYNYLKCAAVAGSAAAGAGVLAGSRAAVRLTD